MLAVVANQFHDEVTAWHHSYVYALDGRRWSLGGDSLAFGLIPGSDAAIS